MRPFALITSFFHSFLGFLSLLFEIFLFIRENQQIPKDEAVLHYLHTHSCSTEYSFFVNITTDIMIAMFQTNKNRVMVLIFLAPRNDKQKNNNKSIFNPQNSTT